MKKRWLICLSAVLMALALCFGIVACGGEEDGKSDADKAKEAIHTIKVLYEGKNTETNDDYEVFGQVKGDGVMYDVVWTVSSTSVDDIETYVKIGKMDESTKQLTIDITRATFDIEYTLKASVTVGSATESAEFPKKIAKKSSEEAVTASLDFTDKANRTKCDTDNNEQVWSQNGITLTNTGNVADYVPIRLYKNTPVTIEMENAKIVHIDFHSASAVGTSNYPEYLKTSLEGANLPIKGEIAVSEDGLTLSVDFETPLETVTFTTTTGQCRLTSIDVEGNERDPNEHVHKWTYEHIANTWTHKATCTAEGCDVNTKTENCTPKLNVCECGYTYSAKEIVDALFALEKDQSLPGTYTLTGEVIAVTELDTEKFFNVTFTMTVEGQTVTVYRAKGAHYSEVEAGGTATVNGSLLDYNGTKEFTQGASVVEFVPGVDDRTPQQKVDAALAKLDSTFTVTKAGATDLPASTVRDVTFTWSTDDQTYPIANNKITVSALPETDATVTATVTASCGAESVTNNTRQVTITIRAQGSATEGFNPITAPAAGSDYYLAMDISGTWYYSTGTMSSHYLGTTTDISKAAKVTVASSGNGWTLETNGKFIEIEKVDSYNNIVLNASATEGKVWMWDADHAVFTMTVGTDTFFLGTYGTFTTFNAAYTSYLESEGEYIGKIGTYSGTVTPPTPGGDDTDADATLSFADDANRSSITSETDIWTQNNVTLTQNKGSGSDIDTSKSYFNPLRIYKNHVVTIEYTSAMAKIVFHCATYQENDYASALKTSLESVAGVTVTVDGTVVTVVLDTPSTSFEFTNTSGQVRLDSIDVYTTAGSGDVGGDTHTCEHVCDICGKCTDESCDDPACADKCEGHTLADTEFTTTTIPELKALVSESGKTTTEKYFAIGIVKSIKDAYNSEIYIVDEEGNELHIYGLFNENGTTRNQKASESFQNGDTIVVYGVMTNYNGDIELKDAWLVQINSEAKTNEAKVILDSIKIASPVVADFNLPTFDGKVEWKVKSGDGIQIESNVAKVTRTTEDQTVELTATAKVGSHTEEKTFTVIVNKDVKVTGETSVSLNLKTNFATYAADWGTYGNKEILFSQVVDTIADGKIAFSYVSKQSNTINDQPVLAAKANYPAYVTLTLSNASFKSIGFVMTQWTTKTFTDIHIEYTMDGSEWISCSSVITTPDTLNMTDGTDLSKATQVRLVINASGSNNVQIGIASISLVVDAPDAEGPQPETDDEKAQRALDELDIPETLTEDYTLSESTVAGVELKFTAESHDAIEIAEGGVKLTVTRPEATADDVTGTVTVTATINGVTKTKVFTITVEKKQAATDPTEQTTAIFSVADYAEQNSWTAYSLYPEITIDENIKASLNKGSNNGKYNASYGDSKSEKVWGMYASENAVLTFTAENEATIVSVKIDYIAADSGIICDSTKEITYATGTLISVNAKSLVLNIKNTNDKTNGKAFITSIEVIYTGGVHMSEQEKAEKALNAVNISEKELTSNLTLPTTTVAGTTLNWAVTKGQEAASVVDGVLQITRGDDDVEVTLSVTVTCGEHTTSAKTFTLTVKAKEVIQPGASKEITLDFVNTSAWQSGWNNQYAEHEVTFSTLGESSVTGSVVFSNASLQGSTFTDRPAVASKGTLQYVTVTVTDKLITAIEFDFSKWGNDALADIHIEYTTDGSQWTTCSDVLTSSATQTLASNTTLPENVKSVRLAMKGNATSSNKRLGLNSIKVTVKDAVSSASISAEVALLPSNKD